jgi:hypothetical protein
MLLASNFQMEFKKSKDKGSPGSMIEAGRTTLLGIFT